MANPLIQNILLFDRIAKFPSEQIFNVIKDEAPQMTAAILARMTPQKARQIIEFFPAAEKTDIVYRMATAKNIPADLLNEVVNEIGNKLFVLDGGASSAQIGGQGKLAEIMKHMDSDKSKNLLESLGKKDLGIANRIKDKMFMFDDIPGLEITGFRRALMRVDSGIIALSLKGAAKNVASAVLSALSENRRKTVVDDLRFMGPRRKSDVDHARKQLMSILRGFLEQGILHIKDDPSDEWV